MAAAAMDAELQRQLQLSAKAEARRPSIISIMVDGAIPTVSHPAAVPRGLTSLGSPEMIFTTAPPSASASASTLSPYSHPQPTAVPATGGDAALVVPPLLLAVAPVESPKTPAPAHPGTARPENEDAPAIQPGRRPSQFVRSVSDLSDRMATKPTSAPP
jgi:hypothetical protein